MPSDGRREVPVDAGVFRDGIVLADPDARGADRHQIAVARVRFDDRWSRAGHGSRCPGPASPASRRHPAYSAPPVRWRYSDDRIDIVVDLALRRAHGPDADVVHEPLESVADPHERAGALAALRRPARFRELLALQQGAIDVEASIRGFPVVGRRQNGSSRPTDTDRSSPPTSGGGSRSWWETRGRTRSSRRCRTHPHRCSGLPASDSRPPAPRAGRSWPPACCRRCPAPCDGRSRRPVPSASAFRSVGSTLASTVQSANRKV